jgi:hypothetical protein
MELRKSIWIILICLFFAANALGVNDNTSSEKEQVDQQSQASEPTQADPMQFGDKTIFPWYLKPDDWNKGVLIALSGLMGALITIYGLIGTVMPGTSGQVNLDAEGIQLELFKKKLSDLWEKESNDINIRAAKELEITINNRQAFISKERWRQFGLAALLYAILGAFFATLLAEGFLQGLLIGAGWTAYLGVVGLKKDSEARGSIKDRQLDEIFSNVKEKEEVIKILEDTLKETNSSIVEIQKKRKVLYAPRGIRDRRHLLFEGTKEKGPWYNPSQFSEEEIKRWERKGWIKYTEI